MWKTFAPVLIVLSVAMNVAFAGTWAVCMTKAYWPIGAGEGDSTVWCPLHRQLDVTPDQWRLIEPRMREFHAKSQAICEELGRLRVEMIGIIAAENPDRQAIAAKQEEIRAGQQRMQELVIEHLLGEKQVLTLDQQNRLFQMMRERSMCAGPGHILGLSGAGMRDN